jgi:hypothetical protein
LPATSIIILLLIRYYCTIIGSFRPIKFFRFSGKSLLFLSASKESEPAKVTKPGKARSNPSAFLSKPGKKRLIDGYLFTETKFTSSAGAS